MPDTITPRARILASLVLAFAVSAVTSPIMLPLLAMLAGVALWLGRAPWRRLRAPLVLAAVFVLGLGLASGTTVLLPLGPLALHAEGVQAGAMIAARMLAIVALVRALLGRLSPQALADGLRGLYLPPVMADMTLLTLRYLDDARAELARAELARRLRGGPVGWRGLPDRAMILAASLIRAQDRAERVWAAMRLRGHGALRAAAWPSAGELGVIGLAMACAAALLALDIAA
ncbi:MAG: cobalt ECF transporter T component CbiQ [Alphaproteobacteria bacterium]|jgi:cobalt/nickel transport system permease protein|nr:cobalt ECF transporter T component CbiQ [Alphaproteobacteria bacterium]